MTDPERFHPPIRPTVVPTRTREHETFDADVVRRARDEDNAAFTHVLQDAYLKAERALRDYR